MEAGMGLCFAAKYFAIRRNLLTSGEKVNFLDYRDIGFFRYSKSWFTYRGRWVWHRNDLAISVCIARSFSILF